MVFPRMSVMVMSTLLNVAEMWAMPSASTTLRDFLTAGAFAGAAPGGAAGGGGGGGRRGGRRSRLKGSRHGLLLGRLLLARDRAARAALGARVGVSPLAPDRQALAMTGAAIAPDVHQPLDVHGDLGTQRAFHLDAPLDQLPEPRHFGVREVAHPGARVDSRIREQPVAGGPSDAVDVGQRDLDPLLPREVHACDARHASPAAACAWGSACRSPGSHPASGPPCSARRSV